MAEQRIVECVNEIEIIFDISYVEEQSVTERICNVVFEVNNARQSHAKNETGEYDKSIVLDLEANHLLLTEYPGDLYTQQQVLYCHINWLVISETKKAELVDVLLGMNREFQLEGDNLYTDELYNNAYVSMVKEHMHYWHEGYFEPEDFEGYDLERHLEYVAYAKDHGL
jgi:hypothetical protein